MMAAPRNAPKAAAVNTASAFERPCQNYEKSGETSVVILGDEAESLLNKWKTERAWLHVVFVGTDKAARCSFVGIVEEVDFPSVQLSLLGSPACEIYINFSGASFDYSDPREAPARARKALSKYAGVLDVIFPDGVICSLCEFQG
jgi:hypothetical protein